MNLLEDVYICHWPSMLLWESVIQKFADSFTRFEGTWKRNHQHPLLGSILFQKEKANQILPTEISFIKKSSLDFSYCPRRDKLHPLFLVGHIHSYPIWVHGNCYMKKRYFIFQCSTDIKFKTSIIFISFFFIFEVLHIWNKVSKSRVIYI